MSYFSQNLKLLEKRNPALAAYLTGIAVPEDFALVRARNGLPSIRVQNAARDGYFLHSAEDPREEARRQLNGQLFKNPDATILFGFGLGYLAAEIAARKEPQHLLCIVERFPALLKLALERVDLTGLLAAENVYFFLEQAVDRIAEDFAPIRLKALSGEIQKLMTSSFRTLYENYYISFEQKLHQHIESLRLEFKHFDFYQYDLIANLFDNFPAMLRAAPLDDFKGLLDGSPVLLIAAGPSLDREMETLRARAADYFTICADAALRPLLRNGVTPDLVVTCDPIVFNSQKIADLPDEQINHLPLLFRADAQPLLVKRFKRHNLFVNGDSSLSHWLLRQGRMVLSFSRCQNVAHLAFLAARFMGADPVILVGLDLAFPKDRAHAADCTSPWNLKTCQESLRAYPATNGGQVNTLDSFISYIHIFEQEIRKSAMTCLNVSQHGALIRGATYLPLDRALAFKKPDPRLKKVFADVLLKTVSNRDPGLPSVYCKALQWLLEEARLLEPLCRKAWDFSDSAAAEDSADLLQLQRQVFVHEAFLKIIADYLSHYLISFQQIVRTGVPPVDPARSADPDYQLKLFFKELGRVRRHLENRIPSVLAGLR